MNHNCVNYKFDIADPDLERYSLFLKGMDNEALAAPHSVEHGDIYTIATSLIFNSRFHKSIVSTFTQFKVLLEKADGSIRAS